MNLSAICKRNCTITHVLVRSSIYIFILCLFIKQTLLSKATSKRELYKSTYGSEIINNEFNDRLKNIAGGQNMKHPLQKQISANGKKYKSMHLNKLQLNNMNLKKC